MVTRRSLELRNMLTKTSEGSVSRRDDFPCLPGRRIAPLSIRLIPGDSAMNIHEEMNDGLFLLTPRSFNMLILFLSSSSVLL
ncbi:hypothetical protein M569_00080 [Genlisea aurea]|uniref:Uncharacterized protein n=1 Tax=Genlisea aurea TaxID=192259 RepID=S8D5K2_9LAMI|nr:hypothetical protein M569_00080 [Genlisea aurea]